MDLIAATPASEEGLVSPEIRIVLVLSQRIIIHSASADASADTPENRFSKLKILLKHSRML